MPNFTDEEINAILQEFYAKFADRKYIGARYVPIFGRRGEESIDWDDSKPYEPLTIVLHEGNSYTSRQFVPAGIPITDADFWAQTGNYDAQLASYQESVNDFMQGAQDDIDAIETKASNDDMALKIGGNGYLVHELSDVNADLTVGTYHNKVAHSKKDNLIFFDLVLRNATENTIAAQADLFTIKNAFLRYDDASTIMTDCDITRYTDDYSVTDLSNREVLRPTFVPRLVIKKDGDDAVIRIINQIRPNSEILIRGVDSTASFQSWWNAAYYESELANDLCDYFLNGDGDTSWEGQFEYSNDNAVRTDPVNMKTDCSGMVYIAYKYFGFHPKGTVQPAYVTNGIFIAYAPAGEPLDLSNARPGDIICYQSTELDADDYDSWTHCTIYAGNNKTYEMALYYPEAETLNGALDGHGPYEIVTGADVYRMTTEVNSITGRTNKGRNRCVVRFL